MTSTFDLEAIERHATLRHSEGAETALLLVRHGRTRANRQGLFLGSTDVPLDRLGEAQADLVANRIAEEWSADSIVSSPMRRALATADRIARRLALQPKLMADLREMDFGDFEGHTFEQIVHLDPTFVARLADIHDDDLAWPGGEQRRAFYQRVWSAFEQIVVENPGGKVVVVAHGGVIGAFMAMLRGQPPSDPLIYGLKNCSITELLVRQPHTEVQRFNCVMHLDFLSDEESWDEEGI